MSKSYFDIIRQYWVHNHVPKDTERLFTLEEVHALELSAVEAERDRIIKLLEKLTPAKPTYEMPMEYWVQRKLVEELIALIRGENK